MMTGMEGPAAARHPEAPQPDPAQPDPAQPDPAQPAPGRETEIRALLAELGTAMIATGQPVQEIEEELAEVGARLGYPDVQTAVGPTGLLVTLTAGRPLDLPLGSRPACACTSRRASASSATSWSTAS